MTIATNFCNWIMCIEKLIILKNFTDQISINIFSIDLKSVKNKQTGIESFLNSNEYTVRS